MRRTPKQSKECSYPQVLAFPATELNKYNIDCIPPASAHRFLYLDRFAHPIGDSFQQTRVVYWSFRSIDCPSTIGDCARVSQLRSPLVEKALRRMSFWGRS